MAELADLAHWLKGAGGTVGFDDFTTPAAQLEQAAKDGREEEVPTALETIQELVSRIQVPSVEQNESAVKTNAGPATTEGVELAEPSAEPLALNPDEEAPTFVDPGSYEEVIGIAFSEAEPVHDNVEDPDTAFLFEEEGKLKEELNQIAASLDDDLEFFAFPEEEIMEPDDSYSQPIEERYSSELEIDNTKWG
jgi:hypothetical protein